jgi:ribosomal protein L11 methyltransferase
LEWIEAKLYTTSQGIEAVCGMLAEAGVDNLIIEDKEEMARFFADERNQREFLWDYVDEELLRGEYGEPRVIFYVSGSSEGYEALMSVKSGIERLKSAAGQIAEPLGRLALEIANVDGSGWLEEWKKYYKPFEICDGVIVCPVWEKPESRGKAVFIIEPGSAFGSGLHQTTRLCAEALRKYLAPGMRLMDLGCGTGILSIIGLLLGAGEALAADLDPAAVSAARHNARLNNIPDSAYTVLSGSLLTDPALMAKARAKTYDLLVINIVADVIINFAPFTAAALRQGGTLIASGIIGGRLEDVQKALLAAGFKVMEVTSRDGWFCLVCENGACNCAKEAMLTAIYA